MSPSRIHSVHVGNSSYESYILGLGPVGYWRLGESSGVIAKDISTNGNNGTWGIGNSSAGSLFLTRDNHPSSIFDGLSYITGPPSNSLFPTSKGTLIAWVKQVDTTLDKRIITIGAGIVSIFAILGGRANTEASAFMRTNIGGLIQLDSGVGTYINNTEYMIAATAEDGDGRLFLDGIQVDSSVNVSAAQTFGTATVIPLTIGSAVNFFGRFAGDMQEAIIFDYVLTPEQIEAVHLIGVNGP